MTRRHFDALASEISKIGDPRARRVAAEAVARAVRQFNQAFDHDRFFSACDAQSRREA
jgi:hypothetical protein